LLVITRVACIQGSQGQSGGRRNAIEDSKKSIAVTSLITLDEFRIVEIVTGVHSDALGEETAHGDFSLWIEQRDLNAVYFSPGVANDAQAGLHIFFDTVSAPVAFQLRIESFTKPVQNGRGGQLRKDLRVGAVIVIRRFGASGEIAAGHQYDLSAGILDEGALFLIG